MASTVGSLDSLDLLDLLFDRQDGILRGVELGTSPGTWHEDGRTRDGDDFLSSILGSGDSASDSPSWSPAASDSGVSEDPSSDHLDSPPGCCDGGLGEAPYPYANPCQVLPIPGGTGAPHPEVSIDLDMWHPGFFMEEGRDLPVVSAPASCTLTVKDLLLSGSSDAVSPHHRGPNPVPIPFTILPHPCPCPPSGPCPRPFLLTPTTSWTTTPFPFPSLPSPPSHTRPLSRTTFLFLPLPGCLPSPWKLGAHPWSLGTGRGQTYSPGFSPARGPAAAAGTQLPAEAEPGPVPGAGADGGREETSGQGGGVPAHAAAPHQVRGAGAEEDPSEDQEQAVSAGEPQEEEGIHRRAGEPDVSVHSPEPGAAEESPAPGEAELVPPGAAEETPGPGGAVEQQGSADGDLHRGPAALLRAHRLPLHQPLCPQQGRGRRGLRPGASFLQVPAQRRRLPRGLRAAPGQGREAPGAAVVGAWGRKPRDPARSFQCPLLLPTPGRGFAPQPQPAPRLRQPEPWGHGAKWRRGRGWQHAGGWQHVGGRPRSARVDRGRAQRPARGAGAGRGALNNTQGPRGMRPIPSGTSPRGGPPGSPPPGVDRCWTHLALLLSVNWEEETGSHWPYWEGRKGLLPPPGCGRGCRRDTGLVKVGRRGPKRPRSGWLLTLQLGGFVHFFFFNFIFITK